LSKTFYYIYIVQLWSVSGMESRPRVIDISRIAWFTIKMKSISINSQ